MKVSASNPTFDGKVPHLLLKKGDISEVVLLPGDPGRVAMFQELCEDFEILSSNREYTIGKGMYKGVSITICSTGIGGASTEIAVLELIELGAKVLIRIGGTGVIHEDINCGEMVITTGATREGGTSAFYAPMEYPCVASYEVVDSLVKACQEAGVTYHKGISASVGSFFAAQGRDVLGKRFHDENLIEKYRNLNVLNMEMESETIITLGSIFGVYTGSLCAVHANRATDEWLYDFQDAQKKMCNIALDAVLLLYKNHM